MRAAFLAVLALAAAEIYLLIHLGAAIGAGPLLALLVGSAVLGYVVARAQGIAVVRRWLAANAAGTMPEEGLTDGLLVLLGGALLALPGVLSDGLGLLLLLPPVRRRVAERIRRRAEKWVASGSVKVATFDGRVWQAQDDGDEAREPWRAMEGNWPGGSEDGSDGAREVIDVEGYAVEDGPEARPERLLGPGTAEEEPRRQ